MVNVSKRNKEVQKVSKSLISNDQVCHVCGSPFNLHKHHIFFGVANRKKSEEDGCWCYLCAKHHNFSNEGVHYNKELDMKLKKECEVLWVNKNGTIEDFIKRYGRNYLD